MKGYDLILKGGHVIDPANNINRKMDIAVLDGKIAKIKKTYRNQSRFQYISIGIGIR